MIKFVLNAFPRTGSTILYYMMKKGNPNAIHLYEPLHDKLFLLIKEEGSAFHKVESLWDGYQKLPKKTLLEMQMKHRDCTNLFCFADIEPYLDVIHAVDAEIMMQPNRMHFILKDMAQKYGCKVVHLCRKPADCFLGFAEIFAMYGKDLTNNCSWWIENIYGFVYFFEKQYEAIAQKFHAPRADNFLDKWLVVWTYQNYYAAVQADNENVMFVFFEDVVDGDAIKRIEEFAGIKLGGAEIIDKKRVYLSDDKFKAEIDKRIDALGLREMVEEIYEIGGVK